MATIQQFREVHVNVNNSVIMPANVAYTGEFDFGGTSPCAVQVDEFMENKSLTFQVSDNPFADNNVYANYYKDGVLVQIDIPTIASGQLHVAYLPPALFAGVRYMRVIADNIVVQDSKIVFYNRPV